MSKSRHLDLGCGGSPRNPVCSEELYGLDLRGSDYDSTLKKLGPGVWRWNVVREKIPFENEYFSSCSAYDFLEHVPRAWPTLDGAGVSFPFVDLMSEVFRVLKPGGVFLAATPAIPKNETFVDPTHVNYLTLRSHEYFCGAAPLARMYGFQGNFEAEMVEFGIPRFLSDPTPSKWVRRIKMAHRILRREAPPHMLWKLIKT